MGDDDMTERLAADDDHEELQGVWASPLCHPSHRVHRFIALLFMCCMGFGSYFAYDTPAALEDIIMRDMNVTTTEYGLLYSLYSWPNVILCFFGGFFIDRIFGIRLGAILFSAIIMIGQFIVATGAFANVFWLMAVGRFVFGIGGESLAVAQNAYAVSWFKNKELNLVFGLQLSLSRLGSTVGMNVMLPLYHGLESFNVTGYTLLGLVFFISAFTCLFSWLCAIILGGLDKRAERILRRSEGVASTEVVRFKDITDFNISFWYLTLICVSYYVCIFPFVSFGSKFFIEKWSFSNSQANAVDGIIYTISAVFCPAFGYLIDLTGRNIIWVFVSTLLTVLSHACLAFTMINPWFPMCVMGIGYSVLACSLWPMVAFIIPEHQLGTAYGIMQSIQNLGLAVMPILAGWLVEHKGYVALELLFLSCLGGKLS